MTKAQIIDLVATELNVPYQLMLSSQKDAVLDAKYIAVMMMFEEGFTPAEIHETIYGDRTAVYHALKKASALLDYHKPFKTKYLACIARMAQMETEYEEN